MERVADTTWLIEPVASVGEFLDVEDGSGSVLYICPVVLHPHNVSSATTSGTGIVKFAERMGKIRLVYELMKLDLPESNQKII